MTDESPESIRESTTARPARSGWGWKRPLALAVAVAVAVTAYVLVRDELTLTALAAREERLREYADRRPLMIVAAAFALYVAVTGLSLPLAAALTLTLSWFFKTAFGQPAGFVMALIVVSFGATTGSTLAFLVSRYLFRDTFQERYGVRLRRFNAALERDGALYLFTLRLLPVVPFFVVNLVMGLTPLRTHTFWWVTQIGMLPATAVYVYAGSTVPSLSQLARTGFGGIVRWELFAALVLLGLLPLVTKKALDRWFGRGGRSEAAAEKLSGKRR